jgi:hypothetical protein
MFTLQFALSASVEPQLLVCAKSPEVAMLTRCKVALRVLLRMTVCEELVVEIPWEAKVSDAGEREATGATPVPDSETEGAVPVASLFSVSVPLRVPRAVGEKETLTVQLPLAASETPQLLVCAKSPITLKLEIDNGALPVLVSVTLWAALTVFTRCSV